MRLKGKKAVITGGGRGIGRAVAMAFAGEGADIVVNYLNCEKAAEEVVGNIRSTGRRAISFKADVSNYESAGALVEKACRELGGIDILVNNAGIIKPSMLLKMSEEEWDRVVDVHLKGTFNVTQACARVMKEAGYGRIINVVSPSGIHGTVGQINYSAAKAGILGFTKSASRELGRYNITVNAVSPGVTVTGMTEKIRRDEKLKRIYCARIPLGRFAEPSEIAPAFLFFASDDAGYVTGQILGVDGGYTG